MGSMTFEPYKRLWRTWAPLQVKIFIWLATWKKCWTADRLQRRGLPHPATCPLHDQAPETVDHILTECVFARETWFHALRHIGLEAQMSAPMDTHFNEWWRRVNRRTSKDHSRGLNTMIILVAWEIWKQRNRCVFDHI